MKKKTILFIILLSVIALSAGIFIIKKSGAKGTVTQKIISISISDIKTIKINTGGTQSKELYFDLSNKEHESAVKNILSWMKSAKYTGNTKTGFAIKGGSPTSLAIELKDGTSVNITLAMSYSETTTSNGTVRSASLIKGQVSIYVRKSSGQSSINEASQQLYDFIDSGWQNIFNYSGR